jgi:Putative peptidoglycan binding domain
MSIRYIAKQGDCISSIAMAHGFLPQTLWDHPENAELKYSRSDMNILMAGDVVAIPDKKLKEVSKETGSSHRFQRKGGTEKLCLRIVQDGKPRNSLPYRLELRDRTLQGTTDSDGKIEVAISANLTSARLVLEEPDRAAEEYALDLGHLDPVSELSGVQMRLLNLGYYFGEITGELDLDTKEALEEFQRVAELEVSGEPDTPTQVRLIELHGC